MSQPFKPFQAIPVATSRIFRDAWGNVFGRLLWVPEILPYQNVGELAEDGSPNA